MEQYKRRCGDRKDGRLLRELDSLHFITGIIYPNRCDNEAYISERVDLTAINAYLAKKNETETDFPYTMFHLIVTALLKTITLRPKLNRFIVNSNFYQRNEVSAAFVVKKQFSDRGAEALAGLSKEYASLGEGHAAYLEAMEALKIARRGGGLYAAGGWDDMAMLCARALKIIEKEYMDEELSLQSVSERLHISANYLGANIKKFYGDTFMNLLIQKRMDVALKLLWGGSSRIAEVSRRCGYADQSYFGYCFKKYYGKSPARMRQEQKEANA